VTFTCRVVSFAEKNGAGAVRSRKRKLLAHVFNKKTQRSARYM